MLEQLAFESSRKEEQVKLLKLLGEEIVKVFTENEVMIVGGAITSLFSNNEINDFDCYFRTKEQFEIVNDWLHSNYWQVIARTSSAITYQYRKGKIQLIKIPEYFLPNAEDIYKKFDFTINQGAYDFKEKDFILSGNFLKHIAQRKLVFNTKALRPINTLMRIEKYKKRGYEISRSEYFKIVYCIMQLKIETYDDLLTQFSGVSQGTFKKLAQKIHSKKLETQEVKPEIVFSLIAEVEEEFINPDLLGTDEAEELPF